MRLAVVITLDGLVFHVGAGNGVQVDFIKAWYRSNTDENEGIFRDSVHGKPSAFMAFIGTQVTTIPYHAVSSFTEVDINAETGEAK